MDEGRTKLAAASLQMNDIMDSRLGMCYFITKVQSLGTEMELSFQLYFSFCVRNSTLYPQKFTKTMLLDPLNISCTEHDPAVWKYAIYNMSQRLKSNLHY